MYSEDAYRSLITLALTQGYEFISFMDEPRNGRAIYLRHDVDYSLTMAVKLAGINASLGIQATFCLLLRSQVYNLLSHESLQRARAIHSLGQHLALHYALPPSIPAGDEEFAEMVVGDFAIVKQHLPDITPAFAWHNGSPVLHDRGMHMRVPGLINMYSTRFVKDIPYYSDTNMRYSVEEFEAILTQRNHPVIHLLFHPLNWIAGGRNMIEILATTWKYIVREREEEMLVNRIYRRHFPRGLPSDVLDEMSSSIVGACSTMRVT